MSPAPHRSADRFDAGGRWRTRKPRAQRENATAGYGCGKRGRTLAAAVPQCPHCGVWFGGQKYEYLPGTSPPKPTTTTARNATPLAGVLLLVLLGLNMLCGVALFEMRDILAHSDDMAVYVGGPVVANVVVIAKALLVVKRSATVNGRVERTS